MAYYDHAHRDPPIPPAPFLVLLGSGGAVKGTQKGSQKRMTKRERKGEGRRARKTCQGDCRSLCSLRHRRVGSKPPKMMGNRNYTPALSLLC